MEKARSNDQHLGNDLLYLIDKYKNLGLSYAEISRHFSLYTYLTACWQIDIEKYGDKSREDIEKAKFTVTEETQKLNLE